MFVEWTFILENADMKRKLLTAAALFTILTTISGTAMAAFTGYVSTGLRLRAGPGTEYPVISIIPGNTNVYVNGCVDGWNWCDVEWNGLHGWTSGRVLQLMDNDQPVAVYSYAPTVGVPVVVFNRNDYWHRYYRDRAFYRTWHRGNAHPHPGPRPGPRPPSPGHDNGHWDHRR
jgi:uncharacterized protein YraI